MAAQSWMCAMCALHDPEFLAGTINYMSQCYWWQSVL